jgi:excisionase family DNA binding protein
MAERLYTTNQLARLFGVVPTTVIDWIEAGKLEAFKTLGGHRRITHVAVLEFLRRNDLASPPAFVRSSPRILVLDDDLEVLDLYRQLLASSLEGVEILTCDHPVDALVRIGAECPGLVVFDLYMPALDGFEFCRRLRQRQGDRLRLLAISGDDSDTTRRRILDCGADRFLSKADAPARLVDACEQLLPARPRASVAYS